MQIPSYRQQFCPKAGKNVVWDTSDADNPVCISNQCKDHHHSCPHKQNGRG